MSLCFDCGCALCCDGTLYSRAPLKEEDFPVRNVLFEVKQRPENAQAEDSSAFFVLPCKLCLNDSCSIHEEKRPAICGEYRCKLYANYEVGNISAAEARSLIESVKKLRDRLRPQLENFLKTDESLPLPSLIHLVVEKLDKMDAPERATAPHDMLLDIGMLRILLAKRFDSRLTNPTWLADKALHSMDDGISDQAAQTDHPKQ